MSIYYAVEINTGTTITDTDYGCVDGVFRFITGRPGYTGAPTYPKNEDDSDNTYVWYEGWISNKGLSSPSRQVDITKTGDYGTLSGFNFKIRNTELFWEFAKGNNIYFTNRTVKFFTVLNDKFYQLWQGGITNNPYDEVSYQFQCTDDFKKLHKWVPPKVLTPTTSTQNQEPVPVSFGNITYSKLTVAEKNTDRPYEVLFTNQSIPYTAAAAKYCSYDVVASRYDWGNSAYQKLHIWTPSNNKPNNYYAGMYIFDVNDLNRGIKILNSLSINTDTLLPLGYTILWLAEAFEFEKLTPKYPEIIPLLSPVETYPTTKDTKFYRISKIQTNAIVSTAGISDLVLDTKGKPMLYSYSTDSKTYDDVSYLIQDFDLDSTNSFGYPYISLKNNNSVKDGGTTCIMPLVPDINGFYVDKNTMNQQLWSDAPSMLKMSDRNRTTSFDATIKTVDSTHFLTWSMDVSKYFVQDLDKLYFGVDFYLNADYSSGNIGVKHLQVNHRMTMNDPYGRNIFISDNGLYLKDPDGTAYSNIGIDTSNGRFNNHYLPAEYYDGGGVIGDDVSTMFPLSVAGGFSSISGATIDGTALDWVNKGICSPILFTNLYFSEKNNKTWSGTFKIKEVGFVGEKTVSISNKNLYTRIKGELTGGVETNSVYTAMKHMLEDYDGIPTTSIDYGNLQATRDDWLVGRQITERKSTFEYIKELCSHSFCCVFPSRTGKRKIVAWRENTASPTTHDSTVIIRDSIGKYEQTQVQDLYTEFNLQYHWNEASQVYDRSFFIANTDQASFPPYTDFNWTYFVGGLENNSYADSLSLWTPCRASYVRANMASNQLPDSLSKLPWFIDNKLFDPATSTGLGVNSSVYKYMENLVEWTTRQKDTVEYSLPLTSTYVVHDLLDPIVFNDPIYTDSVNRTGWITKIEVDPEKDIIKLKATLEPYDLVYVNDGVIIESGTQPDTITESGSQSDTITEL